MRAIKDDLAFTLRPIVNLVIPQVKLDITHAETRAHIDSYMSTYEKHPLIEIYQRVAKELASRPTSTRNIDETHKLE